MKITQTHVLLSVTLRRRDSGVYMSDTNIDRAEKLASRSNKPCAITEGDGKFYTFTVVEAGEKFSLVELEMVK